MTRERATEAIRAAREEKGLTWGALAAATGRSPVWTTAALLGQGDHVSRGGCEARQRPSAWGRDVAAALQQPSRQRARSAQRCRSTR